MTNWVQCCPPYRIARARRATDLPDGLSCDFPVQPLCKKFFAFAVGQITFTNLPRPASQEGRFAIVTDVRRDAVDADALLTNGANADGEDVWS